MNKLKIAIISNFEYHCGSSNTILGYLKACKKKGIDLRLSELGNIDNVGKEKFPIADSSWNPDLAIIVFESYQFLSEAKICKIISRIPRTRRIIIDPDAKYSTPCHYKNDCNHKNNNEYMKWHDLYNCLSDTILQPSLVGSRTLNVHTFLYFGMDNMKQTTAKTRLYDLIYIGNNWFRWQDMSKLIRKTQTIREILPKIAIGGRYWNEENMNNFSYATFSNPKYLVNNNIDLLGVIPFGKVESTMSQGKINPIFIRSILNHMNLVTPRMFETFCADTVPIVPSYFKEAETLYGEKIKELIFSGNNTKEKLIDIVKNNNYYSNLTNEIKNELFKKHSYEQRLKELLNFL